MSTESKKDNSSPIVIHVAGGAEGSDIIPKPLTPGSLASPTSNSSDRGGYGFGNYEGFDGQEPILVHYQLTMYLQRINQFVIAQGHGEPPPFPNARDLNMDQDAYNLLMERRLFITRLDEFQKQVGLLVDKLNRYLVNRGSLPTDFPIFATIVDTVNTGIPPLHPEKGGRSATIEPYRPSDPNDQASSHEMPQNYADTIILPDRQVLMTLIAKNTAEGKDTLHHHVIVIVDPATKQEVRRIWRNNQPHDVRAAVRIIDKESRLSKWNRVNSFGEVKYVWNRAHQTFHAFKKNPDAYTTPPTTSHAADKANEHSEIKEKKRGFFDGLITDRRDFGRIAKASSAQGGGLVHGTPPSAQNPYQKDEGDYLPIPNDVPYTPLTSHTSSH